MLMHRMDHISCTQWNWLQTHSLSTLRQVPTLLRCPYKCSWQLALIMDGIVLYGMVGLRGSSASVDPAGRRSALMYLEVVRLAILASSASRRILWFFFSTSCLPAKVLSFP